MPNDREVDTIIDKLRNSAVPLELAKKMLAPYPDAWIEWSNNGSMQDKEGNWVTNVSPYVSGARVLVHLNTIFGPGGWKFDVTNIVTSYVTADAVDGRHVPHHMLGAPLYIGVSGCFKALDFPSTCDVGEDSATWGNIEKRNTSAGKVLKKGASIKNAQTDAVKRSVRNYGIGLYLWLTPTMTVKNYYKIPADLTKKVQTTGEKIRSHIIKEVYGVKLEGSE